MKRKILYFLALFSLAAVCAFAQVKVKGIVLDENDEPAIAAAVQIKGTNKGVSTDINGRFTLDAPKGGTLVISYLGYVKQEVPVAPQVRIKLVPDTELLDEVIVVAYGTSTKSAFTGSASSVGQKQLEMRPISNVSQAISGAAAGVQTTTGGGQPGSGISVRIRGFGSFNASNAPLYIVDGAPYSGGISDLNPADIESLTILKDAASTSLYGSSAGNGVVLITTKKGKAQEGKPVIRFTSSWGTSMRGVPEYERVGIWDYYPVMWEQLYNSYIYDPKKPLSPQEAGATASQVVFDELKYNPFKGVAGNEIVTHDGKLNPAATELLYGDDTDWEKAITRNAFRQEYGIALSQRTAKSDTYASLGYLEDNGYTIKSMFERYSGRVNSNFVPTKWLKAGLNMSAYRTKSNYVGDGNTSYINPFYFTRFMGPIYPIHLHDDVTGEYILDDDGNKIYDYEKPRGQDGKTGRHILAETEYDFEEYTRDGLNTRAYFTIEPVKDLTFTTNLAYDISNAGTTKYRNRIVGDAKDKGSLRKVARRSTTVNVNQLINYDVTLDDVHHIDALLGHENYYYRFQSNTSVKGMQILDDLYEFGNFITPEDMSSSAVDYRKEGYFTRLNYDYDKKYYGSVSYRRDGTSRFHKDKRWGNFWSGSAAWRIENEPFMEDISWIDNLKLRASYGQTGNDNISTYYAYQTLYSIGWNNFEEPGILFSKIGNEDLLWEAQINWDVALEFSLWRRLSGTIEFFNKESKDLLFDLPLPISSGTTSIDANIGKIRNTGIEVELNLDVIKKRDFTWSIGFNATHLNNEILKLPESSQEIVSGTKKYMEGKSLYEFWLRQFYKVDPADGLPLYIFDDDPEKELEFSDDDCREVDGKRLTTNYKKAKYDYCGRSIPKIYGGFNTRFYFKGFDVGAYFTYQLGGKMYDGAYQSLMGMDNMGGAIHVDAMNLSWKQPGQVTDVPRLDVSRSSDIGATSSRWLTSSNALLLKSLTLGYNLPKQWLSKFDINNVKVTLAGENIFLLSKRKGLNPMAGYSGTTSNSYSASKSFTAGLQITF